MHGLTFLPALKDFCPKYQVHFQWHHWSGLWVNGTRISNKLQKCTSVRYRKQRRQGRDLEFKENNSLLIFLTHYMVLEKQIKKTTTVFFFLSISAPQFPTYFSLANIYRLTFECKIILQTYAFLHTCLAYIFILHFIKQDMIRC